MSTLRLLRWTDHERLAFEHVREPSDLERAEALYRQQRLRDAAFTCGAMFQDPAWDLILDLFIAHAKGEVLSVTAACSGARLPSTTGLRWLKMLEDRKMVTCWRDPHDRRRRLVELRPDTVAAMRVFLGTV